MGANLPGSVLFCCDHNAVRSPMAEGLMKKFYGHRAYVQSAGVKGDLEIDGFSIAVCAELGVELSRHRSRSFDEMQEWGDDLSSFDLIVALSPAAQRKALEFNRFHHMDVQYWPILDPTGLGETREAKLESYRQARDQIVARMIETFGEPLER
ncbi:arsenate-mycothiol transferase ArsC [Ovoidimarina sediminis]|uniref:arsenate-mycothiol transferase ArsC n=1 Tax=Ovoidimarina sediminis TaxID=3079856 RepID=UPI00290FEC00|nr:low molecular weight phosphatase family protein [Rhodophyticola sp. MJ-SS7]MDU8945838.1 low molecular weight phosphatase family protein [Rhodophyticola sp. MJ-SS7]